MGRNDPVHNGHPQTGSSFLEGEERLENVLARLGAYAGPGIADSKHDLGAFAPYAEVYLASVSRGVDAVVEDVGECLRSAAHIGLHARQILLNIAAYIDAMLVGAP